MRKDFLTMNTAFECRSQGLPDAESIAMIARRGPAFRILSKKIPAPGARGFAGCGLE
jgi:hypothetical protein